MIRVRNNSLGENAAVVHDFAPFEEVRMRYRGVLTLSEQFDAMIVICASHGMGPPTVKVPNEKIEFHYCLGLRLKMAAEADDRICIYTYT